MDKTTKNQNKKQTSATKRNAAVVPEKKKKSGTEIFLIIFAAIALVGIVTSIIIGVITSSSKKKGFDYMTANLSKYISMAEDYKTLTVDISADPIEDDDVEHEILKALYKNRVENPDGDSKGYINVPITAGDDASIYYRGYTLEDGKKVDFDGGCNFSKSVPDVLGIGSGQFIVGFELGLLGKNPKDYSTLKTYSSAGKIGASDKIFIVYTRGLSDGTITGTKNAIVDLSLGKDEIDKEWGTLFYSSIVDTDRYYGQEFDFKVETDNGGEKFRVKAYRLTAENQLISLTYSSYMANGDVQQAKTALIDLSDPDLNSKYGEGFREFFASGIPIGIEPLDEENKEKTLKTKNKDGSMNSFFDITVNKTYDVGTNPLTIEVRFPTDYHSENLQGKKGFFDVYVDSVIVHDAKYATPSDIDDAFVTETLKMTADELADYAGDTLAAKYRAKVKADLEATYNDSVNSNINTLLLEHYVKKATVKKLPETEVQMFYDQYYTDIESQYAQYSSYYKSIDAFAREYMKLASNADWKSELRKVSENTVTQKLVFYYIIRTENLTVPDAEYKALYEKEFNEVFEMYLGNLGCKPEKYKTTEEYEAAVEKHRKEFAENYGEEYFRESITYDYAFAKLREFVIVNKPVTK